MIFIADSAYPELIDLLSLEDDILLIPKVDSLYDGIRNHPDLNICILGQELFISNEVEHSIKDQLTISNTSYRVIEEPLRHAYPYTALLNAVVHGDYLIGNTKHLVKSLIETATDRGYMIHHVNQGYSRCTTIPIADLEVITDDKSIAKALAKTDYSVTYVQPGHVHLPGFQHGFIGGTAGMINNRLYFNGDITKHPDYNIIYEVCTKHNIAIKYIPNKPLTDIGSILQYEHPR